MLQRRCQQLADRYVLHLQATSVIWRPDGRELVTTSRDLEICHIPLPPQLVRPHVGVI